MPRRKNLTAQDAFVGVRRPTVEPEAPAPEEAPEPAAESSVEEPSKSPPRRRSSLAGKAVVDTGSALTEALAEAQASVAHRATVERLTLYLPADLAAALEQLYGDIRSTTQVKVGKSVIAGAALRIVLEDPTQRAAAAALALREKLGA